MYGRTRFAPTWQSGIFHKDKIACKPDVGDDVGIDPYLRYLRFLQHFPFIRRSGVAF